MSDEYEYRERVRWHATDDGEAIEQRIVGYDRRRKGEEQWQPYDPDEEPS